MSSAVRSIRFLPISDSKDRQRHSDGEVFYDRQANTLRVYNGNVPGGFKLATDSYVNSQGFVTSSALTWNNISSKPTFSTVATSGSYNDLTDKPTLFSGSYNDLTDKPAGADLTGYATETYVNTAVSNLIDAAPTTLNTLNELAAALGDDANFATTVSTAIGTKEPAIAAGTTAQYWRGDKTWQTLDKTAVGLANVTNESKATMFTSPTFTGTTTLQQAIEVLNTKTGATGTVIHDFSTGAIWYHSSIAANFTANFTNIPVTDKRIIVCTLILNQSAAAYIPSGLEIDGAAQTINWLGGSVPVGSANKKDIVSFTIIRSALTWTVLGSLSSYG